MKKNGQYVGVDEKFIPEDEKYIEKTVADDLKDDLKEGYNNLKKPENKEKAKKLFKIGKNIGIGYLALYGIIFLLVIGIIIFIFTTVIKTMNSYDEIKDETGNIINNIYDNAQGDYNKHKIELFNNNFELYNGTNNGIRVKNLLEDIVTNNKKNNNHIINVIYGNNNTSNTDEITSIKKSLDDLTDYEVDFDYNDEGYIYKVTIS